MKPIVTSNIVDAIEETAHGEWHLKCTGELSFHSSCGPRFRSTSTTVEKAPGKPNPRIQYFPQSARFRLTSSQVDNLFISHFHNPEDGYKYVEEDDWLSDGQLSSSSVIHKVKERKRLNVTLSQKVRPKAVLHFWGERRLTSFG